MRIEGISSIVNNKFQKYNNIQKRNQISFEGDRFENCSTRETIKRYGKIIKYSVDWGWEHFGRHNDTDFSVYYPLYRKLNILKGSEQHLRDIAQSLCMYTDEDVVNFTVVFYPLYLVANMKKSDYAYRRLEPYITEERERLLDLTKIKERLEAKKEKFDIGEIENDTLRRVTEELDRAAKKCENAKHEYLKFKHFDLSEDEHVDDGSF